MRVGPTFAKAGFFSVLMRKASAHLQTFNALGPAVNIEFLQNSYLLVRQIAQVPETPRVGPAWSLTQDMNGSSIYDQIPYVI
jgi:hypothetical protein